MQPNIGPKSCPRRRNPLPQEVDPTNRAIAGAVLEFGRFRVLLRSRQLLTSGVPVELGARAFDLLLILLEADGLLVTKEELLSRVWRGIVVSEENLKVQVSALRKALGADRDLIRTEVGRGYRFTGVLRSNGSREAPERLVGTKPWLGRSLRHQNCLYAFRTGQFSGASSAEGLSISPYRG